MGARIGCGRSYPAGEEPNDTGPWVATSEGISVEMPARWDTIPVLEWLKLHFPEALLIHITEDDGSTFVWRYKGTFDPAMLEFLDRVSKITYGRSRIESIQKGICVACGNVVALGNEATLQEYVISGLCETDQVKVFGPLPK